MWIGSDHDDGPGVAILLQLIQHLEATNVRQAHVEQDQIGRLALRNSEAGITRLSLYHLVSPLLTLLAQGPADQALIVDYKDFFGNHP